MTDAQAPGLIRGPDGRAKAYRPLPAADRAAAVQAGLAAYMAGDFFAAHELMEPAWMGSADIAERALIQGLIKLAAADVHAVRGNARGVLRNLEGALERLQSAVATGSITGIELDVVGLIRAMEDRRAALEAGDPDRPIAIDWRPR